MKKLQSVFLFTIIVLFISLTQKSFAQEDFSSRKKVGIGISLFNYSDYYLNDNIYNNFYITYDALKNLRIESQAGFSIENDELAYNVGIGFFGKKNYSNFNALYGIRVGKLNPDIKYFAPCIGGEYYFAKYFSLSGEFLINSLISNDKPIRFSQTSVILRFYF